MPNKNLERNEDYTTAPMFVTLQLHCGNTLHFVMSNKY